MSGNGTVNPGSFVLAPDGQCGRAKTGDSQRNQDGGDRDGCQGSGQDGGAEEGGHEEEGGEEDEGEAEPDSNASFGNKGGDEDLE